MFIQALQELKPTSVHTRNRYSSIYKFLLWDNPFNGFHQSSSFHSTLQNCQTSQNNTITDCIKRNCYNLQSFHCGFGRNPPRFQPVTSVVQVVYRARYAVSYPYCASYIYDQIVACVIRHNPPCIYLLICLF